MSDVLTTGIVDFAYNDGAYDLAAAKAGGIVAVVHKASEGGDLDDKGFDKAVADAKVAGLLQGAYHFGNGRPGVLQADHFLARIRQYPNILPVLDHESNGRSSFGTMTVADAVAFVQRVKTVTNRYPVYYSYTSFLFDLMYKATSEQKEVLGHCPLWLAQYGEMPQHVPEPWVSWELWQYSDYANGPADKMKYPRAVPGFTSQKQDRSCFRGSPADLASWWKTCGVSLV